MDHKLRIGYFADGLWAHKAFDKMARDDSLEIVFICVRYHNQDTKFIEYGQRYGIPVVRHKNINSQEFYDEVYPYRADLFVSMSFDQIFQKNIMDMPPLKTINCHAGKLPFYRGRNILNWALINDEKEFGITVHYMDEGIDTGDIILQKTYPISDNDTYQTLLQQAYSGCADLLYQAVKLIQEGKARTVRQADINPAGFYCGIRKEGDERLDWNQTSRDIFNFVRAITSPGPIARSFIGDHEMKIKKVCMVEGVPDYKGIPGQVLGHL